MGIKVPTGALGTIGKKVKGQVKEADFFPTEEVKQYLRENVLRPGEELADVTASSAHAEDSVRAAILREAKAAGIDRHLAWNGRGWNACAHELSGHPEGSLPQHPTGQSGTPIGTHALP